MITSMSSKKPAPKSPRPSPEPPKRYNRSVSVQDPLRRVTKSLLKSHGFADPQIFHQWRALVGDALADVSCPMKLSRSGKGGAGGTLTVRVLGAAALEFQHSVAQIEERINRFYGYKAVSRIALEQGPLPLKPRPTPQKKRVLTAEEEEALATGVQNVEDSDLRAALQSFGRAVKTAAKPPTKSP